MWSCCRSERGAGVRVPSRDSTEDHRHDYQPHSQQSHWHSWHEGGQSNRSPRAMLPPHRCPVVSVRNGHRHPPPVRLSGRSSISRPGRWLRDSLDGGGLGRVRRLCLFGRLGDNDRRLPQGAKTFGSPEAGSKAGHWNRPLCADRLSHARSDRTLKVGRADARERLCTGEKRTETDAPTGPPAQPTDKRPRLWREGWRAGTVSRRRRARPPPDGLLLLVRPSLRSVFQFLGVAKRGRERGRGRSAATVIDRKGNREGWNR